MRQTVIGVMGGSRANAKTCECAQRLGALIAGKGWILLNGGRDSGVMAASAQGAKEAGGTVIGILPDKNDRRASPHLDLAVMTGLGDGRNLINVLSSDVVIACRGALGTLSEVVLALKHNKRVILLDWDVGPELARYRRNGQLTLATSPQNAIDQVSDALRAPNSQEC